MEDRRDGEGNVDDEEDEEDVADNNDDDDCVDMEVAAPCQFMLSVT